MVLAVGVAGGMQVGQDTGDMLTVTPPLDVDTRNRIIYWYSDGSTSILSQPLDGGDVTVSVYYICTRAQRKEGGNDDHIKGIIAFL